MYMQNETNISQKGHKPAEKYHSVDFIAKECPLVNRSYITHKNKATHFLCERARMSAPAFYKMLGRSDVFLRLRSVRFIRDDVAL